MSTKNPSISYSIVPSGEESTELEVKTYSPQGACVFQNALYNIMDRLCAGALAVLEKIGHRTQLMQVMLRVGVYDPDKYTPIFEMVIDYEPTKTPR